MARPIEIGFSAIRNHPAVRNLKALEKGLYFALVQACILDGVDPLPYDAPRSMCHLASATPMQWAKSGKATRQALDATLLTLKEAYQARTATKEKRGKAAKACLEESWNKRRLAKQAKVNAMLPAHNFIDNSPSLGILQPTKAKSYRPNDINMLERQRAKNNKLKGTLLTD